MVTAQQAFEDAVRTTEGKLSYKEFKKWFESSGMGEGGAESGDSSSSSSASDNEFETYEAAPGTQTEAGKGRMAYLRRITKLNAFEAHEVFEIF